MPLLKAFDDGFDYGDSHSEEGSWYDYEADHYESEPEEEVPEPDPPDHHWQSTPHSTLHASPPAKSWITVSDDYKYEYSDHYYEFTGSRDPREYKSWSQRMDKYFEHYRVPRERRVFIALVQLTGKALMWWEQEKRDQRRYMEPEVTTWGQLKGVMARRYAPLILPDQNHGHGKAVSLPKAPNRNGSPSKLAVSSGSSTEQSMTQLVSSEMPSFEDTIAAIQADLQVVREFYARQAENQACLPTKDSDQESVKSGLPPDQVEYAENIMVVPEQAPTEVKLSNDHAGTMEQEVLGTKTPTTRPNELGLHIHQQVICFEENDRARICLERSHEDLGHEVPPEAHSKPRSQYFGSVRSYSLGCHIHQQTMPFGELGQVRMCRERFPPSLVHETSHGTCAKPSKEQLGKMVSSLIMGFDIQVQSDHEKALGHDRIHPG